MLVPNAFFFLTPIYLPEKFTFWLLSYVFKQGGSTTKLVLSEMVGPPKNNMTMEKQPFEDVSPIKHSDFQCHVSFQGRRFLHFGWAPLLAFRIQKGWNFWICGWLWLCWEWRTASGDFYRGAKVVHLSRVDHVDRWPFVTFDFFCVFVVSFLLWQMMSPLAYFYVTFSGHLSQIESVRIITFHEILVGYLVNWDPPLQCFLLIIWWPGKLFIARWWPKSLAFELVHS